MNVRNKITIKSVTINNTALPFVIYSGIGNPSPKKVLETIESYKNTDHAIIGAFIKDIFIGDILVGILGIYKISKALTIRHISVLEDYQRLGIGTSLLNYIKKCYEDCKIIAETDSSSVDFYAKSGFICHEFKGQYGNLRYKCEFNL